MRSIHSNDKQQRDLDSAKQSRPTAGKPIAKRVLGVLLLVVFGIVITHLFLQYQNLNVFYQQNGQIYEISNRFDMDDESSVPTWLAQALFLAIATVAFLAAWLDSKKPISRLWFAIGWVGLVFSLDEIATLHEHVLQSLHVLFFADAAAANLSNAWLVITPFVLGVCGLVFVWMTRVLPRRTLLLFAASGVLFLSGAILVDIPGSTTGRESFMNQGILVAIEETLELLAAVLALFALADYTERTHGKRLKRAVDSLR